MRRFAVGAASANSLFRGSRFTTDGASSPQSPNPKPPAGSDVDRIVAALEGDTHIMQSVLRRMDPEARRRLVIAGGAAEWFGKEKIEEEVALADSDRDKFISPKDFENWFHSALKRCPDTAKVEAATSEGNAQVSAASSSAKLGVAVPLSALILIAIEAGLPFVGFGFLDNAVMLIAGDAIDQTVGAALSLSVMASAAMGNVCSGMLGMQVHGFVERLVHRLNMPVPTLSDEQRSSQPVFLAGHIGGTIGIAIGLTLGMLPLLFMKGDDDEEKVVEQAFASMDTSKDGYMSADELQTALKRIGIVIDSEHADHVVKKYASSSMGLTIDDFKKLSSDLRKKQ